MTENEKTKHRVGIVVFLEVEDAVDYRDAGSHGVALVKSALAGPRMGPLPVLEREMRYGVLRAQVADVMEVGMAGGNGYLWTEPTRKGFRYLDAKDEEQ